MSPIVAIVGRPNVGKSTLFNRLCRTRQALVDDTPGVTRDRLYGTMELEGRRITLVDTGGLWAPEDDPFAGQVRAQAEVAIAEADLIIMLMDVREGLSPLDKEIARTLRRSAKPVIFAVNKVDGPALEDAASEFYELGAEELVLISAAHGHGIRGLKELIARMLPEPGEEEAKEEERIGVAIVGRPNVGKSSILNALLGQERVVVSPTPGTTRDAIDTPFSFKGRDYLLIDTAGIRRRKRVASALERAGIFRSLRAIERADVALLVVDAAEGITDQDLKIAGQSVEAGRGLVVALNKWDLVEGDKNREAAVRFGLERLKRFAPWAQVVRTSAVSGKGIRRLLPTVEGVFAHYTRRIPTPMLNKALAEITARHRPPATGGRRVKFYYAAQIGVRPPTVAVITNRPEDVPRPYQRYLTNALREALGLDRGPLRLLLRPRGRGKKEN